MRIGRHSRATAFWWISLSVVVLMPLGASGHWVGAECAESFQNDWEDHIDYGWYICDHFVDQINNTETVLFYGDLVGAKTAWENPSPFLDYVDLFWVTTHAASWIGGNPYSPPRIEWAMWNQGSHADSRNMRLGDQSNQLSIFASYSCSTMNYSDGYQFTRWSPIFKGGLRYAAGSHGDLWPGYAHRGVGQEFAANLQAGWSVRRPA